MMCASAPALRITTVCGEDREVVSDTSFALSGV
jgi:hypothetical protein